jgi:hypothetical protein
LGEAKESREGIGAMPICKAMLVGLNGGLTGGNQFSLSVFPEDHGGFLPSKSYRTGEDLIAEAGKLGLRPAEVANAVEQTKKPNAVFFWPQLQVSEEDLRGFGWSEAFRADR